MVGPVHVVLWWLFLFHTFRGQGETPMSSKVVARTVKAGGESSKGIVISKISYHALPQYIDLLAETTWNVAGRAVVRLVFGLADSM